MKASLDTNVLILRYLKGQSDACQTIEEFEVINRAGGSNPPLFLGTPKAGGFAVRFLVPSKPEFCRAYLPYCSTKAPNRCSICSLRVKFTGDY